MPGFFTDYVNNAVLDCVLGGVPFPTPAVLYLGLSTGTANKSGAVSEPADASYKRVPVPNTLAVFPAASGGTKSNAVPAVFPTPTGPWGDIVSLFVADAPAGGRVLAMADLTAPKSIGGMTSAVEPPVPPTVPAQSLFLSHT